MRILCNRIDLAEKLAIVSRATNAKGTLPILGGIKITAEKSDNSITLEATDLEMSIRCSLKAVNVFEPGTAIVSGKLFADAVKKLSGFNVEIEADDNKAVVRSDKTKCNLPVFPVVEYPSVADVDETDTDSISFEIKFEDLQDALKKVSYVSIKDDPLPFVSGVLFEINDDKELRLVGTDRNRIAIYNVPIIGNTDQYSSVIVPVKNIKEITSIFGDNDNLRIVTDSKRIRFDEKETGLSFCMRLINAQFPRYQQVIPKDTIGEVKINRISIINALERVQLVSHQAVLSIQDDTVCVFGREQDRGSVFDEIKIVEKYGPNLKIGFNIKYLLEYFKAIDCENAGFKYISESKMILCETNEGTRVYTYVAMPIKMAETEYETAA